MHQLVGAQVHPKGSVFTDTAQCPYRVQSATAGELARRQEGPRDRQLSALGASDAILGWQREASWRDGLRVCGFVNSIVLMVIFWF